MRSRFRLLASILVATAGCTAGGSYIRSNAPLGRVVIYRNGVAYYERRAAVDDGVLHVKVPRERVDDFLKSLTVVDTTSDEALPVTIPRQQIADGEYLSMALQTPTRHRANVLLTYVTESPAWKPSYRIAVGTGGKVMFQGWAIVDNTSGENWKGVRVGVGASSALSFRYDLWSVRTVDRATLADRAQFAVAPPTGVSPYGAAPAAGVPGEPSGAVVELEENELRRRPGDTAGLSYAGASSLENHYIVDGVNTSGVDAGSTTGGSGLEGVVTDQASGEPLPGVTVTVESPQMSGVQTAITDERGAYALSGLPPGEYVATFYYLDATIRRTGVVVAKGKRTALYQRVASGGHGEVIAITGTAPTIDPSSTTQGMTLDKEYITNIPVGRTFEGALGSAAGSEGDAVGPPPATAADGDRKIAALVAQLRTNRQGVIIESHAEAGIPGGESRARDRANVVRNQLIDAGMAPARIAVDVRVGAGEPERVRLLAAAPGAEPGVTGSPADADPDAGPVGESHFLAERPMDVAAGTSAMVSIFRNETAGGVVYLYDPLSERGNTRYAFQAVRLDNPTDDTLEPGPVTVYGDKRFIGEGLTDAIPPRATAVVPFALDRQLVIDRQTDLDDRIAKLQTLERGVLTVEVQHLRRTRLQVTSRLAVPTTLYIRHRVDDGWVLVDHPAVESRAGDAQLFAIDVPAGGTREVVISEATPLARTLELAAPSTLGMLEVYVASEQPSAALKTQLAALLATHRRMVDTVERIATLREQLAEYRERTDELHAQIVTLKAVKTGGELMRTLRQKMADTSERVQKLTVDLVDAQEGLLVAKTELADQLAELRLPDALARGSAALAPSP